MSWRKVSFLFVTLITDQSAQDGSDLRSSPVSINCFYKDVVSDLFLCTVCRMRRWSAGGSITSKFCPSRTQHVFNIENKWIWHTSLNKFLIDSEHESREVKNKESTHDNHFQHQGEVWTWRSSHHTVCRIDRKKHLCYSPVWILFEKSPLLPTSWQCSRRLRLRSLHLRCLKLMVQTGYPVSEVSSQKPGVWWPHSGK